MAKKAIGFGLIGLLFAGVMVYVLYPKRPHSYGEHCHGGVTVYRCVKKVVNWRTGPGMHHCIKFVLKNAMHWPIVVEREKDDWVYGRDFLNRSGWVKKKMIQKKPSFLVVGDRVSVYASPRTTSRVKGVLHKNVLGLVVGYGGANRQWAHVKVALQKKILQGWVQSCHIWPQPTPQAKEALP